jgi:choline dehydrogenase
MMESDGGCAYVDEIVLHGKRKSIFRSYLYPTMDRPNVTVLTGALAGKIVIEGGRATGVEFEQNERTVTVHARKEVILSMGAINTPKILMQSGIGDEEELAKFNIPVVKSLPGVGRNLHDHVAIGCVWQVGELSPPQIPRSQVVTFWKSSAELDAPNFYAYSTYGAFVSAENAGKVNPPEDCWSFAVGMRPKSRGSVHLTGPSPADAVAVNAAYLSHPDDIEALLSGVEFARKIGNSGSLQKYAGREIAPGVDVADTEQYLRDGLSTFWHQCGTAKMGTDAMSVVDGELKVHGIEGLRIADGSILPHVTTGNTMAPCVVIGEQAARFILEV